MLRFTGDASGDVCAHARSCFIQLVSKVTLQTFMDSFNEIAKSAFTNDDQFYSQASVDYKSETPKTPTIRSPCTLCPYYSAAPLSSETYFLEHYQKH